MKSLRARLVMGTTVASTVILLSTASFAFVMMDAALKREFDTALSAQAHALSSCAQRDEQGIAVEYDIDLLPEYARDENPDVFTIFDAEGEGILSSPSLAGASLTPGTLNKVGKVDFRDGLMPSGRPGRFAELTFIPRFISRNVEESTNPRPIRLVTGRDTAERDQLVRTIAGILGVSLLLGILASSALLWYLTRRLLRPLVTLGEKIDEIRPEKIASVKFASDQPEELQPVVRRLEQLCERVRTVILRERSFTADAAHELRTPLSGLRTALEVSLTRLRSPTEYQEILGECWEMSSQMQALVDNLLSLARLEAGHLPLARDAISVAGLIRSCWEPFASRAEEQNLHHLFDLNGAGAALIDHAKMRLVLTNLFDNAVTYCNQGGEITVSAKRSGDVLEIMVANSGCMLTQEEEQNVFSRFWRADSARGATGVHCGIGLALCFQLMVAQHGSISLSTAGGWFRLQLTLPAV